MSFYTFISTSLNMEGEIAYIIHVYMDKAVSTLGNPITQLDSLNKGYTTFILGFH